MSKAHPGFQGAENSVAKRTNPKTGKPYGKKAAAKIIGYNKAHASKAARKANPRLNRTAKGK